jgi:hypothetical protein
MALRSTVIVLAVGPLLAQSAGAQRPANAPPEIVVPGCFQLTLGRWSRASRLGPQRPTTVVRLDTLARNPSAPGDLVAERIEPAELAPPGDRQSRLPRPARWRRVGADSVVIVAWSTGSEAEVFYGRLVGDSLHGVVRRTSDAVPVDPSTKQIQWDQWPWAAASGVPVKCP